MGNETSRSEFTPSRWVTRSPRTQIPVNNRANSTPQQHRPLQSTLTNTPAIDKQDLKCESEPELPDEPALDTLAFGIKPHCISNGLFRLSIPQWPEVPATFFESSPGRIERIVFKLQYKHQTNTHWRTFLFDDRCLRGKPERHINIRLDTNLYDYNMQFRLTSMVSHESGQHIDESSIIARKIGFIKGSEDNALPWSNTVEITVPSSMNDQGFTIGEWVRFIRSSRDNQRMSFGTIVSKVIEEDSETNEEVVRYDIQHHRRGLPGRIFRITRDEKGSNLKHLSAHTYIDLTNTLELEETLLVGARWNIDGTIVDHEHVMRVYGAMQSVFHTQYVLRYMVDLHDNDVHLNSMANSVAVHVLDCLWPKGRGYKMRCLVNEKKGEHYNDVISMIQQREYTIGNSMYTGNKHYYYVYYCDVCLCVQGDYSWMYRCRQKKETIYHAHDLCLKCVYDVIKRCRQLEELLGHVLAEELTSDCIRTVVFYAAGSCVKL